MYRRPLSTGMELHPGFAGQLLFVSEVVNGEKVKKVKKMSSEASLIVFWGFLMLTGLKTSL